MRAALCGDAGIDIRIGARADFVGGANSQAQEPSASRRCRLIKIPARIANRVIASGQELVGQLGEVLELSVTGGIC